MLLNKSQVFFREREKELMVISKHYSAHFKDIDTASSYNCYVKRLVS